MKSKILRVLIVEDTPKRQEILKNLYKDHAWILVHTASRAIRLLNAYDFHLISLDYNLAGDKDGDAVASFIAQSRNAKTKVMVHAMNKQGADRISAILPHTELVPITKITKNNATLKRLRQELARGVNINWTFVFGRGNRK
jgi:CheY-like chemotaxis protein